MEKKYENHEIKFEGNYYSFTGVIYFDVDVSYGDGIINPTFTEVSFESYHVEEFEQIADENGFFDKGKSVSKNIQDLLIKELASEETGSSMSQY